jgi:hypothetical protein
MAGVCAMWHHFINLLSRSWVALVAAMGTTTLALVVGFIGFLFILALNLIFKLRKDGWSWSVTTAHFSQNLKDSIVPTAIGTVSLWALLMGVFVVRTVYEDHEALAAKVRSLDNVPKPVCPTCPTCPPSKPCPRQSDSQSSVPASTSNLQVRREIQRMLTKLSEKGIDIRERWKAVKETPVDTQRPYAKQVHQWHAEIESYLRTIPKGDAYSARLNGAVKTGAGGYTIGINRTLYEDWDLLASDLVMLNEFMNDQQLGEP